MIVELHSSSRSFFLLILASVTFQSKVGRGARGIISSSGREVHGGGRGRGGHSRSGGGISNGRTSGHHGHSGHTHGGGHHHGGAHHHSHYGAREGSIRDSGGGPERASSGSGGGGGGGGGGGASGESAEVARKRRELFRQMGDESRLGKAIRQLMRDPSVRQNVASVHQVSTVGMTRYKDPIRSKTLYR